LATYSLKPTRATHYTMQRTPDSPTHQASRLAGQPDRQSTVVATHSLSQIQGSPGSGSLDRTLRNVFYSAATRSTRPYGIQELAPRRYMCKIQQPMMVDTRHRASLIVPCQERRSELGIDHPSVNRGFIRHSDVSEYSCRVFRLVPCFEASLLYDQILTRCIKNCATVLYVVKSFELGPIYQGTKRNIRLLSTAVNQKNDIRGSTRILHMTNDETQFREDLQWNSYFVEEIYEKIYEEVEFAADQFNEQNGTEISDEKIEKIVEDIMDNGLESLSKDNGE